MGMALDPFAVARSFSMEASGSGSWWGSPSSSSKWAGEKFVGGWGTTSSGALDYWTLRERSAQLFNENLYARGVIRRLVTNEINTGLTPDVEPNDELLPGMTAEQAEEWSENTENRFEVWAKEPRLCDFEERRTLSALQREIRREALIEGDILIVLRYDGRTGLPRIQLIQGSRVRSPIGVAKQQSERIFNGVEVDERGRQIAYWVRDPKTNRSKRMAAVGARSGRRLAWLYYGTDRRTDQVRGTQIGRAHV